VKLAKEIFEGYQVGFGEDDDDEAEFTPTDEIQGLVVADDEAHTGGDACAEGDAHADCFPMTSDCDSSTIRDGSRQIVTEQKPTESGDSQFVTKDVEEEYPPPMTEEELNRLKKDHLVSDDSDHDVDEHETDDYSDTSLRLDQATPEPSSEEPSEQASASAVSMESFQIVDNVALAQHMSYSNSPSDDSGSEESEIYSDDENHNNCSRPMIIDYTKRI